MKNVNKQHKDKLSKFEKVAVWINNHIGTVEFTVLCFVLVTIPLLKPSTQAVVFYISSGYLQLVLLPLIILGNNIQNKHAELRADAIYELDKKIEKLLTKKKNKNVKF